MRPALPQWWLPNKRWVQRRCGLLIFLTLYLPAALTVRWLSKSWASNTSSNIAEAHNASNLPSRLIICTGERMASLVNKLYRPPGVATTTFEPVHAKGLSNEFYCYANFECEDWKWRKWRLRATVYVCTLFTYTQLDFWRHATIPGNANDAEPSARSYKHYSTFCRADGPNFLSEWSHNVEEYKSFRSENLRFGGQCHFVIIKQEPLEYPCQRALKGWNGLTYLVTNSRIRGVVSYMKMSALVLSVLWWPISSPELKSPWWTTTLNRS